MTPKQLVIIGHAPSKNSKALCDAITAGAQSDGSLNIQTDWLSPFECDAQTVLSSDAIVLFTTENFGYMNGALKDFFERVYYPCLENPNLNEGKPYALVVKAGLDGTGATQSVERIVNGLKWREALSTLLCKGDFKDQFVDDCHELGLTMAASLDAGII